LAFQSQFEAINENAGRAKAGEPNVHRSAHVELCVERQRLEIKPSRRDFRRDPRLTSKPDFRSIVLFAPDARARPPNRRLRLAARQISVPDKLAVVGIAFDPMSRRENDGEAGSLAEPMLGIDRHGDD
jgi:hypothetical protein